MDDCADAITKVPDLGFHFPVDGDEFGEFVVGRVEGCDADVCHDVDSCEAEFG